MSPRPTAGQRLLALLLTATVSVAGFAGAAIATDADETEPVDVVTEEPTPEEEVSADEAAPEGTVPADEVAEEESTEETASDEVTPAESAAEPAPAPAAATTGAITGRVTVPAGVDVTKLWVQLIAPAPDAYVWDVQPAADGTYRFGGLTSGEYRIKFSGVGSGVLTQYWPGVRELNQAAPVVVGTGTVTGIDAAMARSAVLRGRIFTNGVADLSAVYIRVDRMDDEHYGNYPAISIVDRNGQWYLDDLPTGGYNLEFIGNHAGLPSTYLLSVDHLLTVGPLQVVAGQTYTGLDVTLNGPGQPEAVEAYVTRIYKDLFGRAPDRSGLATWTGLLLRGTPSSAVTDRITASNEFRAGLIRAAYRDYLGRVPDRSGLQSWLAAMRGGMTIKDMQARIIASDEAYVRAGGSDAAWVTAVYRAVLGRGPAAAERDGWVARLGSGTSRIVVARGFLLSTEHLSTVVDGYYRHLLGRSVDPSGRATWVRELQRGARDEEIIALLISSHEYRAMIVRDVYPDR